MRAWSCDPAGHERAFRADEAAARRARVVGWLRRSAPALALPTIAVAEMAFGIEKLAEGPRREELLEALRRLVAEFADRLFDVNVKVAPAYGRILATTRRAGRRMSVPDALTAAIAQVNGCVLATRNVKDFASTGLDLFDPWHSGT